MALTRASQVAGWTPRNVRVPRPRFRSLSRCATPPRQRSSPAGSRLLNSVGHCCNRSRGGSSANMPVWGPNLHVAHNKSRSTARGNARMSCAWVSTILDQERIETMTPIASRPTSVETMPDRTGADVALDVGDRYLARYLVASQVTEFLGGSTRPHWVTPTPLSPTDVVPWLALFAPTKPRKHLLLIDPAKVENHPRASLDSPGARH